MNMQIFSLAGTLFSPSLRLEPLCPCHCSAEGAGLKGTFLSRQELLPAGGKGCRQCCTDLSAQPRCMATAQSGGGSSCVVVPAGGSTIGSS